MTNKFSKVDRNLICIFILLWYDWYKQDKAILYIRKLTRKMPFTVINMTMKSYQNRHFDICRYAGVILCNYKNDKYHQRKAFGSILKTIYNSSRNRRYTRRIWNKTGSVQLNSLSYSHISEYRSYKRRKCKLASEWVKFWKNVTSNLHITTYNS